MAGRLLVAGVSRMVLRGGPIPPGRRVLPKGMVLRVSMTLKERYGAAALRERSRARVQGSVENPNRGGSGVGRLPGAPEGRGWARVAPTLVAVEVPRERSRKVRRGTRARHAAALAAWQGSAYCSTGY